MSNLKQIGLGIIQYTQDYDEKYPQVYNLSIGSTTDWLYNIQPYIKSTQIFNCPSAEAANIEWTGAPNVGTLSYGMSVLFEPNNAGFAPQGMSLSAIDQPSQTILVADSYTMRIVPEGYAKTASYDVPTRYIDYRHLETANTLFCDGHVKSLHEADIQQKDPTKTGDMQFVLWGFPS